MADEKRAREWFEKDRSQARLSVLAQCDNLEPVYELLAAYAESSKAKEGQSKEATYVPSLCEPGTDLRTTVLAHSAFLADPSADRQTAVRPTETGSVEYWKSRAETAELKVLTFHEEIVSNWGQARKK